MLQLSFTRLDLEQLIADTHPLFRLRFPVRPGTSSGTTQMLEQITTEIKKMSDQNAQVAADVAQVGQDLADLRAGFATLVQKINDLKNAATGNVELPAELQAQLNDLHAFAQSVKAGDNPAPGVV